MNILECKNTTDLKLSLLETIDGDGYDAEPTTQKEKRTFLRETFESEYGWSIERLGRNAACQEWLRGLPSSISFPFYVYETAQVVQNVTGNDYPRLDNHDLDVKYWPLLTGAVMTLMYGTSDIKETIETIEHDAIENGFIESEDALSERFDDMVIEFEVPTDDGPMMREWFNNWTDGLCKDGELHERQYNDYCYVGRFDID